MAKRDYLNHLMRDLESHTEVRRFGSGWLSGFFALLFAIVGFGMVIALRFPDWFATPELAIIKDWGGFRGLVHLVLLASYGLALLSLLLLLFLLGLLTTLRAIFLLATFSLFTTDCLLSFGFLTVSIVQGYVGIVRRTTLPLIGAQRPLSCALFQLSDWLYRFPAQHFPPRLFRCRIRGVNTDIGIVGGDLHRRYTRISMILPSISSAVRKLRTLACADSSCCSKRTND